MKFTEKEIIIYNKDSVRKKKETRKTAACIVVDLIDSQPAQVDEIARFLLYARHPTHEIEVSE